MPSCVVRHVPCALHYALYCMRATYDSMKCSSKQTRSSMKQSISQVISTRSRRPRTSLTCGSSLGRAAANFTCWYFWYCKDPAGIMSEKSMSLGATKRQVTWDGYRHGHGHGYGRGMGMGMGYLYECALANADVRVHVCACKSECMMYVIVCVSDLVRSGLVSCLVLAWLVLSCIVVYCSVLCCVVLYCIVLYCIVVYCIVLYCIVLYLCCTVVYCIVLS